MRLHDLILDIAIYDNSSDMFDLFTDDIGECTNRLLEVGYLSLHGLNCADVEVFFLEKGLDVLFLVRLQLVYRRLDFVQLLTQVKWTVA